MDCKDCEVFKDHSGIVARVEMQEEQMKSVWEKWEWAQRMIIGIFVTLSLNLIGVVFLVVRTMPK